MCRWTSPQEKLRLWWVSRVGGMPCTVSHGLTREVSALCPPPGGLYPSLQEPVTLSTTALLSSGSF